MMPPTELAVFDRSTALVSDALSPVPGADLLWEALSQISTALLILFVLLLLLVAVYLSLKDLSDVFETAVLFVKVARHDRNAEILQEVTYLLGLPDKNIKKMDEKLKIIRSMQNVSLNQLIQKHTEDLGTESFLEIQGEGGEAKFYTDFLQASIGSDNDLDALSEVLSFHIIDNCSEYMSGDVDHIVAMGDGNVILAKEVARYLNLPLLIAGNVQGGNIRNGENGVIVGDFDQGDRVLIVDDIGFSGNMMKRSLQLLYNEGVECVDIYVLLKRSSNCDRRIEEFNDSRETKIKIRSVKYMTDTDLTNLMT